MSILIFLPLLTSVDLISSNFFTYFRYIAPYNLVLSMIAILGFLSLFKKMINIYINSGHSFFSLRSNLINFILKKN